MATVDDLTRLSVLVFLSASVTTHTACLVLLAQLIEHRGHISTQENPELLQLLVVMFGGSALALVAFALTWSLVDIDDINRWGV